MARRRHVEGPRVGDRRRAALLSALQARLGEQPLAEIGVGDVAAAAGLSRSAFYFYFPTKAAAVAALLADFEQEMTEAAADWYEGRDRPPRERVARGLAATIALWRERGPVLVAMLDAVGVDPEVREIWRTWTERFVARVAARIDEDRAAGIAPPGPPAEALAVPLLGSALFAMERELRAARDGTPLSADLHAALVEVWWATIYGGAGAPDEAA